MQASGTHCSSPLFQQSVPHLVITMGLVLQMGRVPVQVAGKGFGVIKVQSDNPLQCFHRSLFGVSDNHLIVDFVSDCGSSLMPFSYM